MEDNKCCSSEGKQEKGSKVKIKLKGVNAVAPTSCETAQGSCCCGSGEKQADEPITTYDLKQKWIIGEINTAAGLVPQVSTKLSFSDALGTLKVRFGVNRMNYKVNPGLYAVGTPDDISPVLVTANYKLTFDSLRKELEGLDAWIMVLDTKGVNVWCAAGKGTFGTKELINRLSKVRLSSIVSNKTLILPQLGAPGVSAHEVAKLSGFKVVYGPVRAEDIKDFLKAGMQATEEMREVRFSMLDRAVLTPIEFVSTIKTAMLVFGAMFLINLFAANPFGVTDFYAFVGALLAGTVITPILLPWIPVRAFAAKGWIMGMIWTIAFIILNGWPASPGFGVLKIIAYLFILPSVAAYYSMNFTGSSTYTSFSGVIKEMKIAVPAIAVSVGLGAILLLIGSIANI